MTAYEALRPLLFALPAESAHNLGKRTLRLAQSSRLCRRTLQRRYQIRDDRLTVERFGTSFPSPVGVAAGFDKNGEVTHSLADLGFGFTEVGTVTPDPQDGNPRPRLFRLPEDEGMINRLAFNSQGVDRVRERFASTGLPSVPVGVNVGKMNDSDEDQAIEDYLRVFRTLYPYPDYFVLNVSCPNTPEEYDQQSPEYLRRLFDAVTAANESLAAADGAGDGSGTSGDARAGGDVQLEDDARVGGDATAGDAGVGADADSPKPLLVKVGPDATRESLADLVDIVHEFDVSGIVATNTTTDHDGLESVNRVEWGGVSGRPLRGRATRTIRTLAELTDLPIVGVGGVDSAETAYEKIRAGASLVQLYTGFVYRGPATARQINRGLLDRLEADGFDSVEDAIGVDVE